MKKFDSGERFEKWVEDRTKHFLIELEEERHKKG